MKPVKRFLSKKNFLLVSIFFISLLSGCQKAQNTTTTVELPDTGPEQARVIAEIVDTGKDYIYVKPEDGSRELKSSNLFTISNEMINEKIQPKKGMWLEIIYSGSILETYPASFAGITSISVAEQPGYRENEES